MKKLLTLFFVFFGLVSFGQVYQLMPQYGYQANRMRFDSTLQIPTVCGVPTLKSNVTRLGAIAFDSCNNRFYTYNPKTATWSQVSGGGGSTDTTSLSARIDLKLDSIKRRADSVFAYRNGTEVFQFRDSIRPIDTPTTVIMSVVNATGTTLTKGEVVYLFGATGNTASVKRANNRHDSTSSKTIGVVRRDIAAGATGTVTTQGQVEKLNLAAYNEGDILWLDSLDGQLTKNKPVAPYHAVFIGVVERANNGNGLMYIKPQNGVELDEIHDIQMGTLVNNQVLVYSDTQMVWKNRSVYSVVDTTSLSNRINTKLNASDTASLSNRINTKLNASDTASLSNRINQRLLITDTSVFDRKLIPANSFLANNTAAAANSTATFFKDTSGTYTGTITWTGTTAPSGTTNHTFRYTRIGRMVNLTITLNYSSSGTSNATMVVPFQSDFPTPAQPSGLTAASELLWVANAQFSSTNTTSLANASARTVIRRNSGNNNFEILSAFSAAVRTAMIHATYYTE